MSTQSSTSTESPRATVTTQTPDWLVPLRDKYRSIGRMEFKLRVIAAMQEAGYDAVAQAFVLSISTEE